MKLSTLLLMVLLLPLSLSAQDVPPPNFGPPELERSRECVAGLALLETVDHELEPFGRRAERLEALGRAITVEDPARVAPFDRDDAIEAAVEAWFEVDAEFASRDPEGTDEAIRDERREERAAILDLVREALMQVSAEASELIAATEGLGEALDLCEDAILVRSAVLEACGERTTRACEAARAAEPTGPFLFVDTAEQLWEVERMRSWSEPQRVHPAPDGTLAGGRTSTGLQRGNVVMAVGLEAMLETRSALPPDELEWLDANLDSLGFEFGHPDLVMLPVLTVHLELLEPLAGENAYLLHFGDLTEPEDFIQTVPGGEPGPVQAAFPLEPRVLQRLAAGEEMRLTAVLIADPDGEEPEAEAFYSFEVGNLRQVESVGALLGYWADGGFFEDLAALIPPGSVEG